MLPEFHDLHLWVVEDHPAALGALIEIAEGLGASVQGFSSAEAALAHTEHVPQVVLSDLRLPGMDGLNFLMQLRGWETPPEVIVLTAYGSVQEAVRAMQLGATDFLTKPIDVARVEAVLRAAGARVRLLSELKRIREDNQRLRGIDEGPIYRSPLMHRVVADIKRAAATDATVLILGESGTGKERLAHLLHQHSERQHQIFVATHLASLADSLLESELFGHERGAFTGATGRRAGVFEQADHGTLFMDEIGDIDLRTQVKLLRLLQERRLLRVGGNTEVAVDVRLVCATHRNLEAEVQAGRFREDLFYRLDVVRIQVPPLRERREDIPALIACFFDRFASRYRRPAPELGTDVMACLYAYDWPGNVRELENVVERLVVMSRGRVDRSDLPARMLVMPALSSTSLPMGDIDLPKFIDEVERDLIQKAMQRAGGNKALAARSLGVTREGLRYKLQKLGIDHV